MYAIKWISFVIFCVTTIISGCNNTPQEKGEDVPSFSLDKSSINLGDVKIGSGDQKLSVIISNRGNSDLIIYSITPSCGCTVATLDTNTIKPSDNKTVSIKINVGYMTGDRDSNIEFTSNDPNTPASVLKIKWHASSGFEFTPVEVNFGRVRPGQRITKDVHLRMTEKVSALSLVANNPAILVAWTDNQQNEASGRQLTVQLDAGIVLGEQVALVKLQGNDTQINATIPVRWLVEAEYSVIPAAIFVNMALHEDNISRQIIIKKNTNEEFAIDGITSEKNSSIDLIGYEDKNREKSSTHIVEVRFKVAPGPGQYRTTLRISIRDTATFIDVPLTILAQ